MKHIFRPLFAVPLASSIFLSWGTPAFAANILWSNAVTSGTQAWSNTSNWVGGTAPGATTGTVSTDTATFEYGTTGAGVAVTVDAGRNIKNITFDVNAGTFTIGSAGANGGNALYLTSGGTITMTSGLNGTGLTETFNAPLVITGSTGAYTFINNSTDPTNVLNFAGNISSAATGATTLTLSGSSTGTNSISGNVLGINLTESSGVWSLTGNNTIATMNLNGGTLYAGGTSEHALGLSGGGVSSGTIDLDGTTQIWAYGRASITFNAGGTVQDGTLILSSGSLGSNSTSGVSTISAILAGPTTINMGKAGNSFALTNANTFGTSGSSNYITIGNPVGNVGTLTVSGAGTLGSISNGLVFANGLGYTGTLDLDGTSQSAGFLEAAAGYTGVGGVILNSDASTTSTLTLGAGGGTSATTFSGVIENNAGSGGTVALTKTGTALIALGGPNTYTGATTINQGTLELDFTQFAASNSTSPSNIVSGSSALVLGGGTLNVNGRSAGTATTLTLQTAVGSSTATAASAGATTLVVAVATNFVVGDTVSGTGIAAGTYITKVSGTSLTLSIPTTGAVASNETVTSSAFAAGSLTVAVANTTGLAVGESVTGTGLPSGDYIEAIGSGFIILGSAATGAQSSVATGTSSFAVSQTFNGTTLSGGGSTITATPGASGTVTLNLGTLSRGSGYGTMNISNVPSATNLVNASITGDGSGIIAPWATTGTGASLSYATISSGAIGAYAGATTATTSNMTSATTNYTYGAGNLTLAANSTGNTLQLAGTTTGTVTLGNDSLTLNGLMNSSTKVQTIAGGGTGSLIIGGNKELVITGNTNAITISANIVNNSAGASVLTFGGLETLTLTGTNTYSGGTNINSGTLDFSTYALGAGAINIDGGSLQYTAASGGNTADISAQGVTIGAAGGTIDTQTNNVTFANAIGNGGNGTLTKVGSGTLTLNGADNFGSGGIAVNVGGLVLANANTYTGLTTVASGGILNIRNASSLGSASNYSAIVISSGGSLQLQNTGTLAIGTRTLAFAGTGASGATGALESVSGTNGINSVLDLTAAATISVDSGTLSLNGTLAGAGVGLTLTGAGTGNIYSVLDLTTGTVTLNGTGTWNFTGNNLYSGTTVVNKGTLDFSIGNTSATGYQSLGESGVVTLGVASTSSGTLTYNGTGTTTLAQTITALGNGGDTVVNGGSGLLTLSGAITKNGTTLTLNGGANGINVTGVIAGSSSNSDLDVTSGTTTISTLGTYNGATWIYGSGDLVDNLSGGALPTGTSINIGTAGTAGVSAGGTATSGTFDLDGNNQAVAGLNTEGTGPYTSDVVLNNGATTATLTVSAGGTFAGVIANGSSNTAFAVSGGTMTLSGANTFSGGLTLSGGKLDINSAAALGTGTFTIDASTTIDNTSGSAITESNNNAQTWNGGFTFTGSNGLNLGTGAVTLNASPTVTVSSNTLTVGGVISGSYGLSKNGAGTLVLSGLSSYNGGTTINAGTLQIGVASSGSTSALGSTTATLTLGGGTLDLNSHSDTTAALVMNGSGSTLADSSTAATLTTGSVTVNGSSNTINSGVTVVGNTSLSSSATLADNGAITGAVTVGSGATLSGGGSVSSTTTVNSGAISGSGLTLSSLATFNGAGNTLSGTETGNIALAASATGTQTGGTLTGNVTQNSSSVFTVNGTVGTDALNSSATLAGTGTLSTVTLAGTDTLTSTGTLTTAGITVSGSGNLIGGGTVSGGSGGVTFSGVSALGVTGTLVGSGGVVIGDGTNAATLTLNAGGSIGASPVTVNNAATLAVAATSSIGSSLTLKNGSAVSFSAPALILDPTTLNVTSGTAAVNLQVGSGGTDQLVFSAGSTFGGTLTINVSDISSGATLGTDYTFLTDSTALSLGDFTLGSLSGAPAGATLSIGVSGDTAYFVINPGIATAAYWTGGAAGGAASWSQNSNFLNGPSGSALAVAPSSATDVYFSANSQTNENATTLDGSYTIKGLYFGYGAAAGNPVSIAQGTGSGTLTIDGDGINLISGAGNATISAPLALGADQSWNNVSTGTLAVTNSISGAHNLNVTGTGAYQLSGSNTFNNFTVGTGSDSPSVFLTNGSNGSATGTGTLAVNAGATLGGTGTSSGTSFNISGTSGNKAKVLVGQTSTSDTTWTNNLALIGSTGTSTISNANLSFNLNAKAIGGSGLTGGSNVGNSGNELVVGNTNVNFSNVTLTLNLQNQPGIVAAYTPYVLIAGTGVTTDMGGVSGGQYTGLTLGNSTTTDGITTALIESGLSFNFTGSVDNSYYQGNSYLVLVQTSGGVDNIDVEVVPEPGTWALMFGGLAMLLFWQRNRRRP